MRRRVVITGVGAVAPGALGVSAFRDNLRHGTSGIVRAPELESLRFHCRDAGLPPTVDEALARALRPDQRFGTNGVMAFALLAAHEAAKQAGLRAAADEETADPDAGIVLGTGAGGLETVVHDVGPLTAAGRMRRLGSTIVERFMPSGPAARIAGVLGLGNRVSANSSACATGTEAIVLAADWIASGHAERMLAGGCEGVSAYAWAGFDGMRLMATPHPDGPTASARPLSADAAGFVPAGGAGVLVLESLASARARGAAVLAEILGGAIGSGGQRGGGTMTAPSGEGVRRCLSRAFESAGAPRIDGINGHLTGTMADAREVAAWQDALRSAPESFPLLQATKSLIGHAMGAAGALEAIACVCQLGAGFFHGTANLERLHPELEHLAAAIPTSSLDVDLETLASASFGFGDVNAAIVLRRWTDQ